MHFKINAKCMINRTRFIANILKETFAITLLSGPLWIRQADIQIMLDVVLTIIGWDIASRYCVWCGFLQNFQQLHNIKAKLFPWDAEFCRAFCHTSLRTQTSKHTTTIALFHMWGKPLVCLLRHNRWLLF